MSNVVQFLEALARNPKPLSAADFAVAVAAAELDPKAEAALLAHDTEALSRALGGRIKMMCMVVPAENDEPQQDEDKDSDDEVPEREASSRAA